MSIQYLQFAADVVKPETLREISRMLGAPGYSIADRWALSVPTKMRKMEAAGTLVPMLLKQETLEMETISDARADGIPMDTPDSEILQMYEIRLIP